VDFGHRVAVEGFVFDADRAVPVIAIHGFPGMWWPDHPNWDWHDRWRGWNDKLASIAESAKGRPIWITETGLATWDLALRKPGKFDLQQSMLNEAACLPVPAYWYSLIDLDPARPAIEGFHVDENEYHMGLVTHDGQLKPAYHRMLALMQEGVRV
jgi:CDP-paratose 2-epimerase